MKKLIAALLLGTALLAPIGAQARDVTISTQLANYSGPNAYLAIYLTAADGSYETTLWVAGGRSRYYRDLSGWYRGIAQAGGNIDGITGASVGSGQTLTVTTDIADTLIDAGFDIRVDAAVEHIGSYASDAVAPLSTSAPGEAVAGKSIVKSLTVSM
ncbi:MAG: DUF2271 domain-containing protein [Alphaproteobacteria bacterium]|nr:DUF2271 domain-containing protein [Alphaproteobacteria bacterium]